VLRFLPLLRSFLLIQIKYSLLDQEAAPVVADGQRKGLDEKNRIQDKRAFMSEPEHVDPKDSVLGTSIYRCLYDIIRGRMDHEDELITSRLNWLISNDRKIIKN
jgi:hypothetical protein